MEGGDSDAAKGWGCNRMLVHFPFEHPAPCIPPLTPRLLSPLSLGCPLPLCPCHSTVHCYYSLSFLLPSLNILPFHSLAQQPDDTSVSQNKNTKKAFVLQHHLLLLHVLLLLSYLSKETRRNHVSPPTRKNKVPFSARHTARCPAASPAQP